MKSKQRNYAFWITVFSLSMVPLAASGGEAASAVKKANPKKSAAVKKGATQATAKPSASGPMTEKRVSDMIKASEDRQTSARKADKVEILNAIEGKQKTATLLSGQEASPLVTPESKMVDLTLPDLKNVFYDFDAVVEGSAPNNRATLMGRLFSDCADLFRIEHSNSEPVCGGNATFRMSDYEGRGRDCMAKHRAAHDICADDGTCKYVSELKGATWSLGEVGTVEILLAHRNPMGNEKNKFICESFPTPLRHIGASTLVANAQSSVENAKARQLNALQRQMSMCKTPEQLDAARQANEILAAMGAYGEDSEGTRLRNVKKLDERELAILRGRAAHAKTDELDSIVADLNAYASNHPEACKKLVSSYRNVARKYVSAKSPKAIKRRHNDDDDDSDDEPANPLAGYDSALDMMDSAMDTGCFDENQKMADMRENLELNSVEKDFEVHGSQNMETYAHYYDLMGRMQGNVMETCSGFNVGMECYSEMKSYQNASTLPAYGYETDRRRAQSQMALQQLMMQSAGGGMANASMMSGIQSPGSVGGYYGSAAGGSSFGFGRL